MKVKSCFYSQFWSFYSPDRLHIFLLLFDWDLFAFLYFSSLEYFDPWSLINLLFIVLFFMETTPVCLTANKLTLCRSAVPWQIGGFRFWISRFWPTKCWTGVYRLIGFPWSKWARYWCPSCTVKHDGFSLVRLDFL